MLEGFCHFNMVSRLVWEVYIDHLLVQYQLTRVQLIHLLLLI
nr:MAG TPA: hypothetical protein [Caudoviricetes sp.]DAS51495.1 MAG TPA: hypothetical protein [Caudoviricetes sp.]